MNKFSLLITTNNPSYDSNSTYIEVSVITLENNKPRNITSQYLFETPKTQYYSHLTLKAHYNPEYNDNGLVSHGLAYCDKISADLDECEYMHKTLKSILTKISKLDETRVYTGSKTFNQEIIDFALAIKAEFIVIRRSGNSSAYDDNDYRLHKPTEAQYMIDSLIESVINPKQDNVINL